MPNVTVQPHVDKFLKTPSKRFAQDLLSVPLPFAAFTHTLTTDEWRKAVKFTSTKSTAVSGLIRSSTGYIKCLDHDGTWEAVVGSGNPNGDITTNFTASGDNIPRFYAMIPCDASGNLSGDLTKILFSTDKITTFDATGLSAMTSITLVFNQITSFDGTGLSSLTSLSIPSNLITSFDATELTSLTTLSLSNNQLTSFDGAGLSSLQSLYLANNQLTSFNGSELSSLQTLRLDNNPLTSLGSLSLPIAETVYVVNNSLPASELDALYTALGTNPGTLTYWSYPGIYVAGNPGTSSDDPSIATAKGHTVYGS